MDPRPPVKRKPRLAIAPAPLVPRLHLDTLARVRREMSRLYAEAKHGRRDVQDASRLANILALIGRIIEGGELERRLEELERATGRGGQP